MKRSPMSPRRHPIGFGKPRAALPKVNPERQAKKRVRYSAGLKRYHASLCSALVEDRARGRCEYVDAAGQRCDVREGLEHHHRTYARFGGKEIPADMLLLCPGHHRLVEADKPHKQRRRKVA